MGSSTALSNGKEGEELIDLVDAFQRQNNCQLLITTGLKLHKGYMDLEMEITALEPKKESGEVQYSVLSSVKVWFGDYKTLMGAFTRLLYALDFQLALDEFERVPKKKAQHPAH